MSAQLLINEPPLQVLPSLAQAIGLNEAVILQQVHYWLDPKFNKNYFNGRHWVWNTYEQWQSQFPFWGMNTIRRTIANLENTGLLVSFITRDFKKLKYYSLDYSQLEQLVGISEKNSQQLAANQLSHPSTQNGLIDLLESTDRAAQSGPIELPKMGRSYTKDSENTPSENTPPPLTPPPQFSFRKKEKEEEEEEEEKEIYFEFENANRNSDQDQNPTDGDATETNKEEKEVEDQKVKEHKFFSEMVVIWNRVVQQNLNAGQAVHLTDKRKALLNQFLQNVFLYTTTSEKLCCWEDYCTLIAKSRYLTGHNASGFKVTLEWALIPDNAFKVLEGAIYDKPELFKNEPTILPWEEFSEELAKTLPSSKYLLEWVKISVNLAKLIGQPKYKSWFSKVMLDELTPITAIFCIEGDFTKQYIASHFSSEMRSAVQSLHPAIKEIQYKVASPLGGVA